MSTIYLHIGYPKCFSTTLQRSFFAKHPSVQFGGIGVEDRISYATTEIEHCFESLLKYANEGYWEKHKRNVREHIRWFISKAKDRRVVFSSEHLSMNFTLQGLENSVKYWRLNYLFEGYDIQLLIIRREPVKLLRSLYGEFIRMGYKEKYEDFLKWVLTFQDRNFVPDFNYKLKNKQLSAIFSPANIYWLSFEELKEKGVEASLNKKLANWLDLDDKGIPISNDNPSLSETELYELLEYNKKHPRGLGLAQTEVFERHRSRLQFKYSEMDYTEEEIFSNVLAKRKAVKEAKKNANGGAIEFDRAQELEKRIVETIETYSPKTLPS